MAHYNVHRTGRPARRGAWSDLIDEFRRDLNEGFDPRGARTVRSRGVYPPVNLQETEDAFVLTAELPGVAPEDVDVSLEGATVTPSGQRKIDYAAGNGTAVHRRERQSGHFRRAFELPTAIDVEGAVATQRAGILELTLPKRPEAKPRQIAVQTR
jgi:HSP20 family protein